MQLLGHKNKMPHKFEEIKKNLSHPKVVSENYGNSVAAIRTPEFSLERQFLKKGRVFNIRFPGVVYVESGNLFVQEKDPYDRSKDLDLIQGFAFNNPALTDTHFTVLEDTITYFIRGNGQIEAPAPGVISPTFNDKDTYWGRIETFAAGDFTGKKMTMKKGTQSSLEYHLQKKEAYYLEEGELELGLRTDRAVNNSVVLRPGDVFVIPQGLMHMRIAHQDTVIIEASTRDSDTDTYFVEDGKTYKHQPAEVYSLK